MEEKFKIDLKKLVASGNIAKMVYVSEGKMYYHIQTEDGLYEFFVRGFNKVNSTGFKMSKEDTINSGAIKFEPIGIPVYTVAEDVADTKFPVEMKAIFFMRWIKEAIKNEEIAKIA